MAAVEMRVDLSTLIDALVSDNPNTIVSVARDLLLQDRAADVLLGRIALIASHGDPEGHATVTLATAAMLARLLHFVPQPLDAGASAPSPLLALPLFAQALIATAPAVRAGHTVEPTYPHPFFPSELLNTGKNVNDIMHQAIYQNDADLAERALLGLYGTGADYRTMQVRAYEAISTTFQHDGHPLIFAVRGFQALDAVEWGDRAPNIIQWLAPHLPLQPDSDEPAWIKMVRNYTADPAHSLTSIRTRLSTPVEESALPLRELILSNADTTQVCQGVYDTLIKDKSSPRAIASVISLAAADIIQRIGDDDRALFENVSHGLLFASAARLIFHQVQDVEALNLLFTSASYINALQKTVTPSATTPTLAATHSASIGGGLIAASQIETLSAQLTAQECANAHLTAQRYLKLGHDPRALFGAIGVAAASVDAHSDQGHTLQIVQAAAEEYTTWPATLVRTDIDPFLQVALRAAAFGKRDTVVSRL